MKKCSRCSKTLELKEFCINKSNKDGRNLRCKQCVNTYSGSGARATALNTRHETAMKNEVTLFTREQIDAVRDSITPISEITDNHICGVR
jgi:hypothetical protein